MIVGLLGTDFCSDNRGCGALGYAALEVLKEVGVEKGEPLEVYAFVFRVNPKPQVDNKDMIMHYIKIEPKRLSFWKETFRIFKLCDFVWDFTGGDSFSDIYGMKRFCINTAIKELAIWRNNSFLMAPQTIGPFKKRFALGWARHILRKTDICFVRDSLSKEYVKSTFGVDAVLTTDVAFSLPCGKVPEKINNKIYVGFNPSGLLWDGTKEFNANKHITVDYKEYVQRVMESLCNDERYEVCLIPHVFSMNMEGYENDLKACIEIQKLFPNVQILSDFNTPMEAKGVISTMDIFIGARMHATIAAFSTGVVTIPFSYSRKFEGLYQDLEYPYLISATSMNTEEAICATLEWIDNRVQLAESVEAAKTIITAKQKVLTDALSRIMSK